MNLSLQKTLHQLTGHSDIADTGVDVLFQLTDAYPYFSVPHFFLTKKLKEINHQAFIPQLQKTALYFTNPYWLHYQTMSPVQSIKIISKNASLNNDEETKPLLQHVIEEEIEQSKEAHFNVNETETIAQESIANEVKEQLQEPVIEEVGEEIIPIEKLSSPIVIPTLEQVVQLNNSIQEHTHITVADEETISTITSAKEEVVETAQSLSITSFALEAADENLPGFSSIVEEAEQKPALQEEKVHTEEIIAEQKPFADTLQPIVEDENEEEDENPASIDDIEMTDIKITNILKEQLEEFKRPVTEETALVVESEPYHTIDYFASQGIKHDFSLTDQDQLSKQLRKFTDWLKHMKNAPPKEEDLGTDPELENAIQGIAQTSNEAKEIVTETMAEVLVKQGKIDKAIQLYIKLSFLNPDKSAYFASKIQTLKGI